jgi:nucleoside-diphosphate-sugar epimerase
MTGADGFTGVYARAELEAAGYRVIGAVIGAPRGDHEVTLDITAPEHCRAVMAQVRPDYLMHLAGISFVAHADASAFYTVNVLGTVNLLQAMIDVGLKPQRVLVASSANVYGNSTEGMQDESQVPAPVNHYAVSKLAMEHMVRTFVDRLPIVITRPFNYTGIGQAPQFLVPKIVDHFKRRAELIELGNLDVERDFSDVRMVATAYRGLLEADCAGQTVNICSGHPYALRKILALMHEICGYQIEVRVNPAFVRANEVKVLVGSPTRLTHILGELPLRPLEETLRWMVQA